MNHDNILAHLQMCFDCLAPNFIVEDVCGNDKILITKFFRNRYAILVNEVRAGRS